MASRTSLTGGRGHDGFGLREAINEVPDLRTAYHGLPDQFCVDATNGLAGELRVLLGPDALVS